jgi:hypothetical protein
MLPNIYQRMSCTWGARGNDFPNLVFDLVDGIARAANPPESTTPFDDKVGSGYVSSKKLENCSNDYHSTNHAVSRWVIMRIRACGLRLFI